MCSSVLPLLKTTNLINEYNRLFETGNVKTHNKKKVDTTQKGGGGWCWIWKLTACARDGHWRAPNTQELKGCNAIIAIGLAALRGSAHLQCLLCTLSIALLLAQRVKWCSVLFLRCCPFQVFSLLLTVGYANFHHPIAGARLFFFKVYSSTRFRRKDLG